MEHWTFQQVFFQLLFKLLKMLKARFAESLNRACAYFTPVKVKAKLGQTSHRDQLEVAEVNQ